MDLTMCESMFLVHLKISKLLRRLIPHRTRPIEVREAVLHCRTVFLPRSPELTILQRQSSFSLLKIICELMLTATLLCMSSSKLTMVLNQAIRTNGDA